MRKEGEEKEMEEKGDNDEGTARIKKEGRRVGKIDKEEEEEEETVEE